MFPAFNCSMKLVVPDFARVPRFWIMSFLVIPMPESWTVIVRSLALKLTFIESSEFALRHVSSDKD